MADNMQLMTAIPLLPSAQPITGDAGAKEGNLIKSS